MLQVSSEQLEAIKQAVRQELTELAASWHSQSKMNSSETEYGDGYSAGQNGCSEHLLEVVDQVMGTIDNAVKMEVGE
ncbi:hypothetical protein MUB04_15795 [Acinetobacter indicus]|uniref:hypothetical protein n=1 Tax=Acinetobacter TaxID=469 RepID=UPI0015D2957D|nr:MULTISPECIES: hypothetical protein [Acinetobacter]MCP0918001.1 hypothetical protein [Acinetobacter indicus]